MGEIVVLRAHRGGSHESIETEDLRDDREELTAVLAEGRELGYQLVSLVRLAQRRIAVGASAATVLDTIERIALRHEARMIAAAAARSAAQACPDERRRSFAHGRAA